MPGKYSSAMSLRAFVVTTISLMFISNGVTPTGMKSAIKLWFCRMMTLLQGSVLVCDITDDRISGMNRKSQAEISTFSFSILW